MMNRHPLPLVPYFLTGEDSDFALDLAIAAVSVPSTEALTADEIRVRAFDGVLLAVTL